MTFLWFVTAAALVVALIALGLARRTAKRLEQLTQSYWELKYQYGELRVQLQPPADRPTPEAPMPTQGRDSFVPLSSLKR